MKFDHIGMTTSTLAAGRELLAQSIGVNVWTEPFSDVVNDVIVQFGRDNSGICYELVAPLSRHSPITGVLTKRINVLNHVAYLVEDLKMQSIVLRASGFVEVGPPRPAIAYGDKPIQFFISASRLMIELIEAPRHIHNYLGLHDRS